MKIEVNALRAGGKTIVTSPNDTTKVTSKARILKGTALSGTTIDTTLTITASTDPLTCVERPLTVCIPDHGLWPPDGDPNCLQHDPIPQSPDPDCIDHPEEPVYQVISSGAAPNDITLGVGKGGKGASILIDTEVCGFSGWITFDAEFKGLDVDGETCTGTRTLRKQCRG